MEAQAEIIHGNHSDHLYLSGEETQYDELIKVLEECLKRPDAPLAPAFLNLRVPEMAIVVNQLRLSDAAELIRRLPLNTATDLCDFPDLNRRALICEQLAPELAVSDPVRKRG